MFRLETYINDLISLLKETFEERLLYVGLQGSYLRNESSENSDIDIMVVIDDVSIKDLNTYRNILVSIGNFDKSCGFICGRAELSNWNPLEICHLLHTTFLFAVWHIGYIDTVLFRVDINNVPFIMLMKVITGLFFGIVLGAVRYKTQNCYSTILLHSLMNIFGR